MWKKSLLFFICILQFLFSFFSSAAAQTTTNLSVTATVPAQPTDFQAALSSSTTGSPFPQNTEITYQISYGSILSYSVGKITVQADWSLGTVEGSSTPTVDLLDYVVGSSSNGYNSTPAVVDTVNKKISWTISNFPANTIDQTVSFKIKTNSSYTGSSQVNFSVKARVIGPGTQTADSTVTRGYKYVNASPTATPTPGPTATPAPGPTSTPAPGPTATPGPTLTPTPSLNNPLTITRVEVRTISAHDARVFIQTSSRSTLTLNYGKSPSALTQILKGTSLASQQELTIPDLDPNTAYYFKINAIGESGPSVKSDIFTFKSALSSEPAKIDAQSVVVVSSNIILFNPQQNGQGIAVIPNNTSYSFRFTLAQQPAPITNLRVIVRNKQVLGIQEAQASEPNEQTNTVVEISPGVYSVLLKSSPTPGYYEVIIRMADANGNITENRLFDLKVTGKLTVLEQRTNKPIENVQILLYLFNQTRHGYQPISPEIFPIKNPSYTDKNGTISFPLPQGKYRAGITALGYTQKTVDFSVGPNPGEDYPTVYLEKKAFNLAASITYYGTIVGDWISLTKDYIKNLSNSSRFFELEAILTIGFFVYLTVLSFSSRIRIPLHSFFSHFYHHIRLSSLNQKEVQTLSGKIIDGRKKTPLGLADVFLINRLNEKILTHTKTPTDGFFSLSLQPGLAFKIMIVKDGYKPAVFTQSEIEKIGINKLVLTIQKTRITKAFREEIMLYFEKVFGLWFEALLIFSAVLELALGYSLGWTKALPFIIISFVNVTLWILHLIRLQRETNIE